MKVEVTHEDIARGKVVLLVLLCLILGQEFGLWRAALAARDAQATARRMATVVERQHAALESCQGQVETQLLWLSGRHEGVETAEWPTLRGEN